ncbi:MAG: LicD family protein [Alphaproteobacteria bacterium]|nr:LicD family protein [Alphaproteobacteria bacterium]MBN2675415.1 LicD family protein [Alphaproteobacteria bacterium]
MFKHYFYHILSLLLPIRCIRSKIRERFPKPLDRIAGLENLLVANFDIKKVPSANGYIKMIQDANMKLVAAFDRMCKENDIQYFMGGGALIGKLRHDNWIPWDDDIDIHVVGKDWKKLIKLLQDTYPNNDFYATFNGSWHNLFKIIHRGTNLQLDLFRFEICASDIAHNKSDFDKMTNLKIQYSKKVKSEEKRKIPNIEFLPDDSKEVLEKKWKEYYSRMDRYEKAWKKTVMNGKPAAENGAIMCFSTYTNYTIRDFHKHETVFPFKHLEYCGLKLPFPNNIENYTAHLYGDIFQYPRDMFTRHGEIKFDFFKFTELKKLLESSADAIYKKFIEKK